MTREEAKEYIDNLAPAEFMALAALLDRLDEVKQKEGALG